MKFFICLLIIFIVTPLTLAQDENRSEISKAIHEKYCTSNNSNNS